MTILEDAVGILRRGGVIAYPTESVWGLGCAPQNKKAVQRILEMKKRPEEKGLILVAGNIKQVEPLISRLEPQYREILEASWPGPNTWLVPDVDQIIPSWIKGQFATVAVRVSDHPLVADLCQGLGGMLVSTSANPADKTPAMTQAQVQEYFPEGVDFVVPGEPGGRVGPSEIRDLMSQQVIRGQ